MLLLCLKQYKDLHITLCPYLPQYTKFILLVLNCWFKSGVISQTSLLAINSAWKCFPSQFLTFLDVSSTSRFLMKSIQNILSILTTLTALQFQQYIPGSNINFLFIQDACCLFPDLNKALMK